MVAQGSGGDPAGSVDERRDNEPPVGLLALAVRLDVVAALEVLVHDLALERGHRLEGHRPVVVDGGLGGLVGGGAQRDGAALAIAGGVDHDALADDGALARHPVGDVLDRVDHLAVAADQETEVVALEVGADLVGVLLDVDTRAVDNPNPWSLSFFIEVPTLQFALAPKNGERSTDFQPNDILSWGANLGYKGYSLDIAVPFPEEGDSVIRKGKTQHLDLVLGHYEKSWGGDVFYQTYKGFYLSNGNEDGSDQVYPQRPDVRSHYYGLNLYYAFSPEQFPLAALDAFGATPEGIGDDENRLANLVEDDHPIVERERHVGNVAVIVRSVGQTFGVADDVVPGVADCPAAKARQTGKVPGLVPCEKTLQIAQRIARLELLGASLFGDDDVVAEGFDPQERIGTEKAVASDLLASHDALEEK